MTERIRWQYRVVDIGAFSTHDKMRLALGHLGEDGWELVTVYDKASNSMVGFENGFMLFKRPVQTGEEPTGAWAEVWNRSHLAAIGNYVVDS